MPGRTLGQPAVFNLLRFQGIDFPTIQHAGNSLAMPRDEPDFNHIPPVFMGEDCFNRSAP
jgi:hypothetical protein